MAGSFLSITLKEEAATGPPTTFQSSLRLSILRATISSTNTLPSFHLRKGACSQPQLELSPRIVPAILLSHHHVHRTRAADSSVRYGINHAQYQGMWIYRHQSDSAFPEQRLADEYEKTLSNLYSLTSSLFGVTAGILGLESYNGFLLYVILSLFTTLLVYFIKVAPDSVAEGRPIFDTHRFVKSTAEFWTGGLLSGLSGFVLTWTLFYGLVSV